MSDDHTILGGHREVIAGLAIIIAIAALMSTPAEAAPIEARFPEDETHGNLLVRSLAGETIGRGEMTQVIRDGDLVENRLVFHFKDGSLHDEKVIFSQLGVYDGELSSGPTRPIVSRAARRLDRPRHRGIHCAIQNEGAGERGCVGWAD